MTLPVVGTTDGAQAANQSIAAIADVNGNIIFVGPSGFSGSTLTCVITVPMAPSGALFAATLGTASGQGIIIDTWGGESTGGQYQVVVGQTLVVTGSGLVAGTQYTCTFGIITDVGAVQVVVPTPNSSALLASLASAGIAGNGVLTQYQLAVPSGTTAQMNFTGPIQIWSWGWLATSPGTEPTKGSAAVLCNGPFGVDNLSVEEGASSRLSGLKVGGTPGLVFVNNFDQTVTFFVNYSGAGLTPTAPTTPFAVRQFGDTPSTVASGAAGNVLPAACALGSIVAVLIVSNTSTTAGDVASVTSPMGTFTRVNSYSAGATLSDMEWWICLATTGASRAITVTTTSGGIWAAAAVEFTGTGHAAATGGFGTTLSLTITNIPGQIVLAAAFSAGAFSAGPAAPWAFINDAGGFFKFANGFGIAWQISTVAPVTAAWTSASGTNEMLGLLIS